MDNTNTLGTILIISVIAILIGGLILLSKGLLIAVIILLGCAMLCRYLLKNFEFWQCGLIILVSGYFILTRGFSYVGFQIGEGYVFIGEIVIFLTLISCNLRPSINKLISNSLSKWIIGWVLFGFVLIVMNFGQHKLISIVRDFAIVYYSIFLLFGYAFYKSYKNLDIFYKIIGWIFILHAIWGLFYMAKEIIVANSPKLMGFMPLFGFREDADSLIFISGVIYFLLIAKHYNWSKLLAFLSVAIQLFLILIFQSRSVYVACLLVFLFLSISGIKRLFYKIVITLILIFTVWAVSNIEIKATQTGSYDMSVKGTVQEFTSIFKPNESGTASFRLIWWKYIIEQALEDPKLLLFGKGFGPSLAIGRRSMTVGDYMRRYEEIGGMAKSPHNFLMTLFGRMGITGLSLWLVFNCTFFLYMFKGIKMSKFLCDYKIYNILIWIICFVLAIIGASIFAVILETPFIAIPYFFFMGLGIAIVDSLKERVGLYAHTPNP